MKITTLIIALTSLMIYSLCYGNPVHALSDSETRELLRSSPEFKEAQMRLVTTWSSLTPAQRMSLMKEHGDFMSTLRDKEAEELMKEGLSKGEAYAIVTHKFANFLVKTSKNDSEAASASSASSAKRTEENDVYKRYLEVKQNRNTPKETEFFIMTDYYQYIWDSCYAKYGNDLPVDKDDEAEKCDTDFDERYVSTLEPAHGINLLASKYRKRHGVFFSNVVEARDMEIFDVLDRFNASLPIFDSADKNCYKYSITIKIVGWPVVSIQHCEGEDLDKTQVTGVRGKFSH
jgi:hypothetical protein